MNFSSFCHTLSHIGERRFCVLEGNKAWQTEYAHKLISGCAQAAWFTPLKLGDNALATQAQKLLGQECSHVIYDFECGVHPDVFGLISGVLKSGGLFIFLAPSTPIWNQSLDVDLNRYISFPTDITLCTGFFLGRLQRLLKENASVLWISEKTQDIIQIPSNHKPHWHVEKGDTGCFTQDQQIAVDAIHACYKKRGKSYVLITANRGRGKSSAMGLAAQRLKEQTLSIKMAISAPRPDNTRAFFELAPNTVSFIAPDELLRNPQALDLLFIDEAAAIPAAMLLKLLKRYPKIIFASTEQGYEGSGKGFSLQFKKFLRQSTTKLALIHLDTPIRWAKTDPLEPLMAQILGLDNTLATIHHKMFSRDKVTYREMPVSEYAQDEKKLNAIYSLLSCAHYQTKPSDLRALLDKPNQSVMVAEIEEKIVGVLWLQFEGNLPETLRDKIWGGYKRVRGHVLPQSLSAHLGFAEAIHMRFARIMRIVTHPDVHRQGIGSQFLSAAESVCRQYQCQYIGAMYAADREITEFWLKNKFSPVRLGIKADTSSGARSLMILKSLDSQYTSVLTQWQQKFHDQLLDLCPSGFKDVDPDLILHLLPDAFPQIIYTESDFQEIYGFVHHHRGFEYTLPALRRWLLSDCQQWIEKYPELIRVLIALCLQYKSLRQVCDNNRKWSGEKALLTWLKAKLAEIDGFIQK